MAISKKITNRLGIETYYHIISSISFNSKEIKVNLYSFANQDYYKQAIKRKNLIEKQDELVNEMFSIDNRETISDKDYERRNDLAEEVNRLADEIHNSTLPMEDYVLNDISVILPYSEELCLGYIESMLIDTEIFKNGKLVK